ncbi:MAG: acylphosphatase [Gammaproteobacteria bacterium]|nr:acylphosphatase [Gammaproteobacteria bacterium]
MSRTESVEGVCHGRVQGVAFRASMQREAERLGVQGWVRNQADGSVRFLATGAEEAVRALVDWARRGPSAARVDRLELDAASPPDTLEGFEVRR